VKVAVIGSNGQLGSDVIRALSSIEHFSAISVTHNEIDVRDRDATKRLLVNYGPDWVVNTAAYHKLIDCEQNPDIAFAVNAAGARNVAVAASEIGARVIHISTDYVFRGDIEDQESYSTASAPDPVNVYGKSKLAGEHEVLSISSLNSVVRISSVFGSAGSSGKGGNFIEAILAQLKIGKRPTVLADGRMSPTYTVSAAQFLLRLINQNLSGIFHASNAGSVCWFDFACYFAGLAGYENQIDPIAGVWDSIPRRPRNSSLHYSQLDSFNHADWRNATKAYMIEKGHIR
jgi:dTDP-4-dehydrorhamnose reductase